MKIKFDTPYVKWGLTSLIVLCSAITFFFLIQRADGLFIHLGIVIKVLMPFVYGLVVAYLLGPIYNAFMKGTYRLISKKVKSHKSITLSRVLSTALTMIVGFLIVGGLVSLVLPQIAESLINLIKSAPETFKTLLAWSEKTVESNKAVNSALTAVLGDYTEQVNNWLQDTVLPWLLTFVGTLSSGVLDVLRVIKDFIIGIIICVYFLNSKELFKAQSKKMVYAFLKKESAEKLIEEMGFINRTFGAFISGKIIDSAIIGFICFVFMSIFHFPYIMLVSVIIGVTNIIPFFGPFIGAVPAIIIIMTVDPIQAVYFMAFILVLQQVDGNIIGPYILGDATGLPSFWVMFAIIVGGGMFGFVGMIVGIPIFAVIYAYFSRMVDGRLEKKNLPLETDLYMDFSYYVESRRTDKKRDKREKDK